MKKKIIISCLSILISVSGCSSNQKKITRDIDRSLPQQQEVPASEVYESIADSAKNASHALTVLSEMNVAAKSDRMTFDTIRQANWRSSYVPKGMGRRINSLKWDGPIEPILKQLERYVDYEVRFNERSNPVPHIITLDVKNDTIINIIRRVSSQTEGFIDFKIFEDAGVIEVNYVN